MIDKIKLTAHAKPQISVTVDELLYAFEKIVCPIIDKRWFYQSWGDGNGCMEAPINTDDWGGDMITDVLVELMKALDIEVEE